MMKNLRLGIKIAAILVVWVAFSAADSEALITGVTGPNFTFTAETGHIGTADGNALFFWGLSDGTNPVQYPGPTMIVNEGDLVTVTLVNNLPVKTSLIFPGQDDVQAVGGDVGVLTQEAEANGGAVTYSFIAANPGTYYYQSGTDIKLQIEMGIFGALIVRSLTPNQAYDHPDSAYDREVLFLESQMDPVIHELVETGRTNEVDWSRYFPNYWFLNGRTAPDTMTGPGVDWLPSQPYNCMPRMHPGERMLLRYIDAGNGIHPFHTHANHMRIIAKDGMLLQSAPGNGADLSYLDYTTTLAPGETEDAIFTWTGERLGWDIYGHSPTDPPEPNEYMPDHGKPIPVIMPDYTDLAYTENYSGSPYLGQLGFAPPGIIINNLHGGYFYMWHSHNEREMVNGDTFPGGMMTMLLIEHPSVVIDETAP